MILHVDSAEGWRGGQAQVLNLMLGLRKMGREQCLICPPGAELGVRARTEGIDVEMVRMSSEWDWRAPSRIVLIARKREASVIHAHASLAHGLCWRALSKMPQMPLLVTRRVDFRVANNFLSRQKYLHPRTHYIAISSGVRDVLVAGGVPEERIAVVHSGIDFDRWTGQFKRSDLLEEFYLPDDVCVLLNVAALADHKGQRYLLDAMPEVLRTVPQAHLFVVGEGELREKLEQQIHALGLQKNVTLTGFRSDVEKFFAAADLFVLSSHLEGLCTSLLDAQCFSIPAVATAVGGVVDVIQHEVNGWLVEAKKPSELAETIILALKSPALRKSMGEQGRRIVEERFSASAMVEGTAAMYARIASGGRE